MVYSTGRASFWQAAAVAFQRCLVPTAKAMVENYTIKEALAELLDAGEQTPHGQSEYSSSVGASWSHELWRGSEAGQ